MDTDSARIRLHVSKAVTHGGSYDRIESTDVRTGEETQLTRFR